MVFLLLLGTGVNFVRVSAKFKNRSESLYLNGEGQPTEDRTDKEFVLKNEDTAIVMFELEGGALASMCLSEISAGKVNELRLNIICKDGRADWSNDLPDRLNIAVKGGDDSSVTLGMQTGFSDSYINMFSEFYKFVNSGGFVSDMENNFAVVSDACKNVSVCRAILKSAENDGTFMGV